MCGIVGIYQKKPIDENILNRMTDSLEHRGPDDRGVFIDGNIGLGHRRLSVIDLSPLGHQPMVSEDGRFVIAYNGEIYNFKEVRKELEDLGYKFKSQSDTEVILNSYQEWGIKALSKFNGMWAFVILDTEQKKLFACRDRLGLKPLYYYFNQDNLILASEIRAILEYPDFKVELNLEALNEYFTFQNIFSDQTLFSKVHLLPAGSSLIYDGRKIQIEKWWDIPVKKEELTTEQWEGNLREKLISAVKRHLVSDVEIGSFLSGGMDSATITTLASHAKAKLKTFTAGFDTASAQGIEATFDERDHARQIATACRTDHHEIEIHAGSMVKTLPEVIWSLEDLRMGMCYPNYLISQEVGKYVKVVLSGAAGDELFGGYPWRYNLVKDAIKNEDFDQKYYEYWTRLIKDKEKEEFFTQKIAKKIDFSRPFKIYRQIISPVDNLSPVEKALYFELKTFLHGLFIVEDKVSSAHSIEVRCPFTDLELIELACAMPAELKSDGQQGKIILRKVMKEILPLNIAEKKKQGFSAPEGSWYKDKNLEYVKEILLSEKTIGRGYFQKSYLEKIIDEHVSGEINHRLLIWSLLSFEWWCRIFIDGQRPLKD